MRGQKTEVRSQKTEAGKKSYFLLLASCLLLLISLTGCTPERHFKHAQKLEEEGKYVAAAVRYEQFSNRYPDHRLSVSALLNAARLYNYNIRLPAKSAALYRTILTNHQDDELAVAVAKKGLLVSPDYFPLFCGAKWTEGDSASGGANMRVEWSVVEVSDGIFELTKKFLAGGRVALEKKNYFKYSDFALLEATSVRFKDSRILFKYPLVPQKKWTVVKNGRRITYAVAALNETVTVRAGTFYGCLKISERYSDIPNVVKYNYYAPYVGWVLTTISTSGRKEHRNSELLSYSVPSHK